MSKFFTAIPVDVEAVKALLPKGTYVHGAFYRPKDGRVEVVWECDDLHTGRDFAVQLDAERLSDPNLASHFKRPKPANGNNCSAAGVPTSGAKGVGAGKPARVKGGT